MYSETKINPLITSFGYAFSALLSGSLLVEMVMSYPGLGSLIYESFIREDPAVVMAGTLVGAFMLMLGNLIADILLAWSDPRIRLEDGKEYPCNSEFKQAFTHIYLPRAMCFSNDNGVRRLGKS